MEICPRCGNKNSDFFAKSISRGVYCRKCQQFIGKVSALTACIIPRKVSLQLTYSLSEQQIHISNQLLQSEKTQKIRAVCGAGKTEMVLAVMKKYLESGKRVGFMIPRSEIVKEIFYRLSRLFLGIKVIAVYGGHTHDLEGDLIIFTAHQAYRYVNAFALLIIDEVDAFPYRDNETLHYIVQRTCLERIIEMSATMVQTSDVLTLNSRYHHHAMPIPVIKCHFQFFHLKKYIQRFMKRKVRFFIYVPTIAIGNKLKRKLRNYRTIAFIHAASPAKQEVLKKLEEHLIAGIITTTVLERGVTYRSLQVVVYQSDHSNFDSPTLIQISGRVGRKVEDPNGEIIFLCQQKTKAMKDAIDQLEKANQSMSHL